MNPSEIGTRIKQLRKEKKLTQEKLAELTNLTAHYIYEIERGTKNMSLYSLHDIAATLDASTDYILYGTSKTDECNRSDRLELLINSVPADKREQLAGIITTILERWK